MNEYSLAKVQIVTKNLGVSKNWSNFVAQEHCSFLIIFLEPLIQLRFIREDAASSRPIRRRHCWPMPWRSGWHQGKVEGVRGPVEAKKHVPRLLRCHESGSNIYVS